MNNYNYMNYNWYRDMDRKNTDYNNQKLFNPKEGFIKGNMFSNLYNQYKNYQPVVLNPKNEQQKLLFDLQGICFAAHELNLYLDTHPEDQSMLMLFNDYCEKERKLVTEYEGKYGPLMVSNKTSGNTFAWVDKIWPWEVDNV